MTGDSRGAIARFITVSSVAGSIAPAVATAQELNRPDPPARAASGGNGETAAVEPPRTASPPVAAVAPSPDAGQTEVPASDGGIGDIIVNQQRVPISIAAFKGETLRTLNVVGVVDLPALTPGLSFTRAVAGFNAFLRGAARDRASSPSRPTTVSSRATSGSRTTGSCTRPATWSARR